LLALVAFLGMVGAFASAIRDIHRLSDRACLGWQAEARGNCQAFARYYAQNNLVIFSVFAVVMAVLLISIFKPTGK
jgi:hypothetical protein